MKIKIITFGKLKNSSISELLDHYRKLVSKYFEVEIVEIKDPGERKIEYMDVKDKLSEFNILLTERGKEFSSVEFSNFIEKSKLNTSSITFVLGNAYGLSEDLNSHSKIQLSLSQMTFPHELSLIILLEQLFRAGSIASGSKYHK